MKKLYFIMLLLFFFFSFSITAQTMQVQGHLLGDEKQDLESATVRCYPLPVRKNPPHSLGT